MERHPATASTTRCCVEISISLRCRLESRPREVSGPGWGAIGVKPVGKTLRITASQYREILHETLLRGKETAVPALKAALLEVETHLGWSRERRAQIVLRLAGGFGTTEVLTWLLSRGDQVVANISNHGRVHKLRQHLGPWQPTSSPGRAMAAILRPHRFCRATRQWVIRTPQAHGGYH